MLGLCGTFRQKGPGELAARMKQPNMKSEAQDAGLGVKT